jgi:hypothetical protein
MANCVAAFPPAVGDEIELLNFDSSGAGGEFPPGEPGSLPDFPESTGIELAQAARPLTEFDDFWDFTKQVGQKEIKENKNENQVYHAMFRWTQNEKNDDYFGDHELLEKQLIKLSKDSEYVFRMR